MCWLLLCVVVCVLCVVCSLFVCRVLVACCYCALLCAVCCSVIVACCCVLIFVFGVLFVGVDVCGCLRLFAVGCCCLSSVFAVCRCWFLLSIAVVVWRSCVVLLLRCVTGDV